MSNIEKIIRKNWIVIIALIIFIGTIVSGFAKYFDEYYNYSSRYYEDVKKCQKTKEERVCKIVNSIESPSEKLKKEETRDLYFNVLYNELNLTLIAPLIIITILIGKYHSDFSSGFIKNRLTRESLKDYRKRLQKGVFKTALILPLALLVIFLISGFITKFNFNLLDEVKMQAQYDTWNYNNFPLYLIIHGIILYIVGVLYGYIALFSLNKTKNKLLAIILSYLIFFVASIFLYVIIYAILVTNLLHIDVSSNYFNLAGHWVLYPKYENYWITMSTMALYAIISSIIFYFIYQKKEKVLVGNEKESV